jgi:PhnB protein
MFLLVDNVEKVYQSALTNGATSLQELADRDYGKSAGFQDSFGNQWWVTQYSNE